MLDISESHYDETNYKNIRDVYDTIICGSDQIWNIHAYDFHEAYLLKEISSKDIIKIAYAVSLGGLGSVTDEVNSYQEALESISDFRAVSLREYKGKELISSFLNKKIHMFLDPVFLIDRNKWEHIATNDVPVYVEDYIFFYSIEYKNEALTIVKEISKKTKLPVLIMYTSNRAVQAIRYGFKIVKNKSPNNFLNLIKNAKFVLTTSFHGTAFSIIFNKSFWTIKNTNDINDIEYDDRIITLLTQFSLEDRIINLRSWQSKDIMQEISLVQNQNIQRIIAQNLKDTEIYIKSNCEKNS
jgi:hypothetical protein